MKRIIVLLGFVLFGTILYSQTVNYIYNSEGEKIYFNRTGKNVIKIEKISDTNVVKEIKMLDSNAIVLTNRLVITNISSSLISTFSTKSSISTTELFSKSGNFYWVEKNSIILKVKPNINVDILLKSNNIGYKKRERLGSIYVFIVELNENCDPIVISNLLYESGNVIFAQPNWTMYGNFD